MRPAHKFAPLLLLGDNFFACLCLCFFALFLDEIFPAFAFVGMNFS